MSCRCCRRRRRRNGHSSSSNSSSSRDCSRRSRWCRLRGRRRRRRRCPHSLSWCCSRIGCICPRRSSNRRLRRHRGSIRSRVWWARDDSVRGIRIHLPRIPLNTWTTSSSDPLFFNYIICFFFPFTHSFFLFIFSFSFSFAVTSHVI